MHVVSDDERREVARSIMEIKPCKSGHIKWWEIARALGLKQPAGWFGWEKFEPDSVNRLADLIEPSCDRDTPQKVAEEMFGKMRNSTERERVAYADMMSRNSVELHPVDRDALLALADEMDAYTECDDERCGKEMPPSTIHDFARRIREALGVDDG